MTGRIDAGGTPVEHGYGEVGVNVTAASRTEGTIVRHECMQYIQLYYYNDAMISVARGIL